MEQPTTTSQKVFISDFVESDLESLLQVYQIRYLLSVSVSLNFSMVVSHYLSVFICGGFLFARSGFLLNL